MAETMEKPDHDQYTVGWISALPLELAAARAMLDDDHGCTRSWDNSDVYNYHLGQIGVHNVVLACLLGMTGTVSAAAVAAQMSRSFPSIRFGFMVGIGGGVPSDKNDIRLGDVVVSKSAATFGGVVQYDFGRRIAGGKFERTGSLNKPPQVLRSTLSSIEAEHLMYPPQLQENLRQILQKKQPQMQESYSRPYQEDDLYRANYNHVGQDQGCSQCDKSKLKPRPRRSSPTRPKIHYGTIASGNSTIMDGISRDKLIEDPDSVLCVEKEAAGLMDDFPCLVIRGICDYADSHKNKEWQNYAAAIAATYTKLFLDHIPKKDVEKTAKIQAVFLSRQNSPGLDRGKSGRINVWNEATSSARIRKESIKGESPSSPRSPVTPYSPPTQGSNNSYFSSQASSRGTSSPPSDRTMIGRISSFSEHYGDRPRSRSPRPLPECNATVSTPQTSRVKVEGDERSGKNNTMDRDAINEKEEAYPEAPDITTSETHAPSAIDWNTVRIHWTCKCGQSFKEDIQEQVPGAASELARELNYPDELDVTDSQSPSDEASSSSTDKTGCRPRKSGGSNKDVVISIDNENGKLDAKEAMSVKKYILLCLSSRGSCERLEHANVTTSETDRCMYQVLRQGYFTNLRRSVRWLTMRTLDRVEFVRFQLYWATNVAIEDSDVGSLPPNIRNEYEYDRQHPTRPIVPLTALKHFTEHPDDAPLRPTHLKRIPKKVNGGLAWNQDGGEEEGWGLRFRERICWIKVFIVEACLGTIAIIFAIVWCRYHHGALQDGFTVAAVILAYGSISLGLIQGVAQLLERR